MFLSEIRNFSQKVRVRKPLRIFSTAGGTTTLLPDGKPDIPLYSTTTSIAQIILVPKKLVEEFVWSFSYCELSFRTKSSV